MTAPAQGTEPRLGHGLLTTVRLLPAVSRAGTAGLAVAVLVAAALPVAFIVASGRLVGRVPEAVDQGLGSPAGRSLLAGLALVAVLFLAQQVLEQVIQAHGDGMGRRLNGLLRERVMAATLSPVGIAHLEDPANLDTISLARNVAPGMYQPGGAVYGLAATTSGRLAVLGSAGLVARFSWPLAAALVVVWAVNLLVVARYFFATVKVVAERHTDLRRSVYFRDLALTPGAAKESRVFGLAAWIEERFVGAWRRAMEAAWAERRRGRWSLLAAVCSYGVALGGAMLLVGRAGARGDLSLEEVSVLAFAVMATLALSISDLDLVAAYGAASVPALLSLEQAVADRGAATGLRSDTEGRPSRSIRFEGVSFTYPGATRPVFDGLDLDIPAGQRLAIVGTNGAGKTTLIKLLTRLYEPTAGRITVDGDDLADLDPAAWRRQVAALFQDFVHYELPVADNVAFGAPHRRPDEAALARAVERAGAAELVAGLDDGWRTVLSRQVTGGTDLSGGQWQRIALARAMLAVDAGARVLVLDEPTANLDVRAEARIYDRFLELTASPVAGAPLTTIVVSHRFSTVRRADRIVVVDEGRLVEDGSHDELLAAGGRYATMFRVQAARFGDAGPTTAGVEHA